MKKCSARVWEKKRRRQNHKKNGKIRRERKKKNMKGREMYIDGRKSMIL